ncbi:hypothetical protein BPOR_0601g00080 [Botrytis porri]|uniref:Uncharacterized protein n=1 Tax=Botrytis porri TaxID=87229 RepID=A0A4Z1KE82_9HELO|nr:hypothetical protein BPOR_0601g00080 [Botrytis porri]
MASPVYQAGNLSTIFCEWCPDAIQKGVDIEIFEEAFVEIMAINCVGERKFLIGGTSSASMRSDI